MRSLPSSSSSESPGCSVARISGCGSCTREASPSSSSRSNRNRCPSTSSTLSFSKTPTRSLGPCRSARMAMGWSHFFSMLRMMSSSSFFSSWAPWLKLRRKTSAPARNSFSIISKVHEAGPSVASCLVALVHRREATLVAWAASTLSLMSTGSMATINGRRRCGSAAARLAMLFPAPFLLTSTLDLGPWEAVNAEAVAVRTRTSKTTKKDFMLTVSMNEY
mmetsp:Transcript_24906/g.37376  ORF Transcript_24906/g.37376 Transcript_24906/m.37376 type:complete len:220 (+) Transcript_24906:1470-2129(+)